MIKRCGGKIGTERATLTGCQHRERGLKIVFGINHKPISPPQVIRTSTT